MEPNTMNDRRPNKDSHSELEEKLEVEAELLTQNIYELLSCDLQMYLLTFLTMGDLYQISLSCKHGEFLVLSAEADCFVWKMMAHHLGFNKQETIRSLVQEDEAREEVALSNVNGDAPPNMLWRELVHSNLIKWDANTRTPDSDIKMHNNDKTISCERDSKWDTIRTNRKLEMGFVHGWEYSLDEHDNGGYNAYRIFVGIERGTYAFTEVGTDKIIGYSSQGVGYNIGQHSVHREHSYGLDDRSVLYEEDFKFSSGDTIALKFDLKNLTNSNTATMYLFKNNQYFMTIADIPTQDIVYYPAISVIGRQRVSIRMKRPSTLDTTNRTQISQSSLIQ